MNGENLTFEVVGHPEPAGSKTNMPRRRFPVTLHSMRDFMASFPLVDANAKSKGWKEKVAQTAKGAMLKDRRAIMEGPLWMSVVFRVDRPASHFRSDGETLSAEGNRHQYPAKKPDALKLARAVEDALSTICYHDDAQIVSETLRKVWTPHPSVPEGVTVTIRPM